MEEPLTGTSDRAPRVGDYPHRTDPKPDQLILMGDGKVVYVPHRPLTESTAKMVREAFEEWSDDPARIAVIMGHPVEIIDNRPKEPRTVAEIVLREAEPTIVDARDL